uniref:Vacuolar protein sorting-associated protein 33B n=1 Tax=Panagrolaimus superbus TaxID=310955 RepID=A0A914YA03_9BILA
MDDFDDFAMVTQLTRRELIHVLESIIGTKELVVEQSLMRPLDKVASMSFLKEHNCLRVQQLYLDRLISWDPNLENRVFLIRPSLTNVRKVCELIKAEPNVQYSAIFVDRKQNICDLEFEKQGVYGNIESYELNLSFIPLESDLFSLELPADIPRSSRTDYQAMARCLWQLQSLYGAIPNQFAIGQAAVDCQKVFQRICQDMKEPAATANQPISHLFLFDRSIDVVSVLLTGLTYESMLNDVFKYSCGKIVFGEAVETKLKQKSEGKKVIPLNNSDAIFSVVRNRHMSQVFPFLSARAKTLQESFDKASAMNKVEEVKDFISNQLRQLKQNHKLLELHICACEVLLETSKGSDRFGIEHAIVRREADANIVMEHLELAICKQQNPWAVLQLACLWSICEDGLLSKHFHAFRNLFLHACGYDYLTVFYYLQSNGLLIEKSTPSAKTSIGGASFKINSNFKELSRKTSFSHLTKSLRLTPASDIPFDPKSINPNPSYVFSDAYTPIACQIVSQTVADGWSTSKLQKVFGPEIPITSSLNPVKPDNRIKKALLVSFIGGVTFAEVAALRQFAQNSNFRIIVVASHVLNREEFLKSFIEIV